MSRRLAKRLPIVGIDVRLAKDAAQRTYRNLVLAGNDGHIRCALALADKLDVTALLGSFDEAGRLEPPLDLAKREGSKPPQSLPQSCESSGAA